MFEQLVNKQLRAVCFVVVKTSNDCYRLDDTLIFRVEEKTYQLIVNQASQSLREVSNDEDIIVEGGLLGGERVGVELIDPAELSFPAAGIFLQEIKEYWADESSQKFLMGVIFSDLNRAYELPILTAGTEAEIVSNSDFYTVIHEMGFPYEVVRLVE